MTHTYTLSVVFTAKHIDGPDLAASQEELLVKSATDLLMPIVHAGRIQLEPDATSHTPEYEIKLLGGFDVLHRTTPNAPVTVASEPLVYTFHSSFTEVINEYMPDETKESFEINLYVTPCGNVGYYDEVGQTMDFVAPFNSLDAATEHCVRFSRSKRA
jgi:hypothetical protein